MEFHQINILVNLRKLLIFHALARVNQRRKQVYTEKNIKNIWEFFPHKLIFLQIGQNIPGVRIPPETPCKDKKSHYYGFLFYLISLF